MEESEEIKKSQKLGKKEKNEHFSYIYIRECFFSGDTLGYLLSNGIIGIFYKNTMMNVILEYGSANYFIIAKDNGYKPIKKPLPTSDFELKSMMQIDYVQLLMNFKSFFVTKYGYFKLDEMRKKQAYLVSDMEM